MHSKVLNVSFFLALLQAIEAAKILAVLPSYIKSHSLFTHPIAKGLASRGHHVTIITPFEDSDPPENYKQILADKKSCFDTELSQEEVEAFMQGVQSVPFIVTELERWHIVFWFTEAGLNSSAVQEFIKQDDSHYDLVITELFMQEAFLMFAHKYKAPVVMLSSFGSGHYISEQMGNPLVLSAIPFEFIDFYGPLNLWRRARNVLCSLFDLLGRRYYHLPSQQKLAEMHFGHLPGPLPQLADLERNVSLILVNTHFSIDSVRPYVPGIVEIGGVHIKPKKHLPNDLKKICDDAKDGIIFFSLGSNLKGSRMPPRKIEAIVEVFGSLKQTVLWKWENDSPPKAAKNVIFSKWFPQAEILGHPNAKLYITHGGLLGIQEAIYYGVPILGMPFFGDQFLNVDRAVEGGYGLQIFLKDVTVPKLNSVLTQLLNDPKFEANAEEISRRFKDKPMSPLDTAMYWIEYVIRHHGARHMRSPIIDQNLFQYLLIDVVAILVFGTLAVGATAYCIISVLCKLLLFRKPHKRKPKNIKVN